ncbi:ArsR family transcriptional regulator [Anderseniella sp. Alg231-50]|uniref:ArsR family transcriptional regulator n=1 Tax=Anderseniella sp. Alg231-50 TaxID=1922226 RepID=UPI000D55BB61
MSTRDDILSLLRRDAMTIPELLERLNVTRNAVIVPLKQLEADGLVEGETQRGKGVGKPAVRYSVVSGREDITSQAYPTFAELTMQTLAEQLPRDQVSQLMRQVGEKMATHLDVNGQSSLTGRLQAATDFLDTLGAETVVDTQQGNPVVRSFSCPLGRAVRQEPCVCSVVAAFLSDVTGTTVDEQCDRGEKLFCKFVVKA